MTVLKGSRAVSVSSRKSADRRAEKGLGAGCLRLFFLPFFLIGMALVYGLSIHPMIKVFRAQSWEKIPCAINSSEVVSHSDSDGTTYSIKIVYQYNFDDRSYTSERYHFGTGSSSGRKGKQAVVDKYPPGSESYCFVNPSAPQEAVLDRGLRLEYGLGAFGLLFAGAGAWGLIYAPRMAGGSMQRSKSAVPKPAPASDAPGVLKPKHTPMSKLLGMLAFSVIWNGFVGIFVYFVFFEDAHRAPFIVKCIIGLFAVIGIATIFGVFTSFLALFNPRVAITAQSTTVSLGGELCFRWEIKGRSAMLRRLRIILEGREEATYKRGTSTSTDTQVFAEIPVFESTDQMLIAEGSGRVSVPITMMHTFEAARNKVLWRLKVEGEIPRWPDVTDEYPITVLPLALRK